MTYTVQELREMAKRGESFRPGHTRTDIATAYADLLDRQAAGVTDEVVERSYDEFLRRIDPQAFHALSKLSQYATHHAMRAALLVGRPVAAEPAHPAQVGRHEPDCNLNMASVERQSLGCDCKLSEATTDKPVVHGDARQTIDDALYDSAFCAGLNRGFALGHENDNAGLAATLETRSGYVAAMRAARATLDAAEPVAQPAGRQGEAVADILRTAEILRNELHYAACRAPDGWCDEAAEWQTKAQTLLDYLYTHPAAPVGAPAQPNAVPEGYVLVPREASGEMLDAAIDAYEGFVGEDEVDAVWSAMLAAAPSAPQEPQS